jgi:hypothetical protein
MFAWLIGKRGLVLSVSAVLAAVFGAACGHPHGGYGFWDWP